jgi:hypothetical protein
MLTGQTEEHTMLYIKTVRSPEGTLLAATASPTYNPDAESRNDWKTFDAALEVAEVLGTEYIATDAGPHVSPRYDVIKLPQIGDKVSQSFNGDSYPAGTIKSISKSLSLIITTTGLKFYRVRETGSWRNNQTWSLRSGHHDERNPSF